MRAWYLMMGGLVCLALAPPVQGGAIYTSELKESFNGAQPVAPSSGDAWLIGRFVAEVNGSVTLVLNSYLGSTSEFFSDVAFCVPKGYLPGLTVQQINTVPTPGSPASSNSPVVDKITVPATYALVDVTGGGLAGKGFDIHLEWKTQNKVDRYDSDYNGYDVQFKLSWGGTTLADSEAFVLALAGEVPPRNDPNNGHLNLEAGRFLMAAHVQGIPSPGEGSGAIGGTNGLDTAPEPGTWLLVGMGGAGLVWHRCRQRRQDPLQVV